MFGRFKLASALVLALSAPAFAADTPGVTPGVTETGIKVGATSPFSGPASLQLQRGPEIRGSNSAAY
jgi:branched-chain amino acid transport system substrate-binding protein